MVQNWSAKNHLGGKRFTDDDEFETGAEVSEARVKTSMLRVLMRW
jgi:hypothetical protein